MKRESVIVKLARYARDQRGMATFTSRDLLNLVDDATAYYNSLIPPDVYDRKREILAKHNFTEAEWADVLRSSSTFYFCPDERAVACNREIRALFATVDHISSPPQYDNYVRALVNVAVRRGHFVIVARNPKGFTYRLK